VPEALVALFAAGILLWEMLSGRRLFRGETDVETFQWKIGGKSGR